MGYNRTKTKDPRCRKRSAIQKFLKLRARLEKSPLTNYPSISELPYKQFGGICQILPPLVTWNGCMAELCYHLAQ